MTTFKLTPFPAALLAVLALAACGGDDDSDDEPASPTTRPPAAETTSTAPTTPEGGGAGAAPGEDELRETLVRWYATKDCDLMTDRFLESFTPVSERGTRSQNCANFKKSQLTFDPKTIKVTKAQVDGEIGRVEAKRTGTSESPTYELVVEDGEWKVNGNCRSRPGCMEAFEAG